MSEKETLINNIENYKVQVSQHKELSLMCEVDSSMIILHDKVISYYDLTKEIAQTTYLSVNYINQFQNDLSQTLKFFPYLNQKFSGEIDENAKLNIRLSINKQFESLDEQIYKIEFNLTFFQKLNFFKSNIVAIGANGSGKTTLSNDLKKYLPKTGVVISAQKVMIVPTFSGVSNYQKTNEKLNQSQQEDKTLKVTYSTENNSNSWSIMTRLGGEFQVLLDNLLAERSVLRNEFCDALQSGASSKSVPASKLDKALKIWNSLIEHRTLECKDGINITLKTDSNSDNYPAHQMSDGEKVTLYLIAHILQAPVSGFIIIDEPEMYLHKTILQKLWDILEKERQDCIFIYLTHDLDFATSRITAKKVWIKSFKHPNTWEIENIPENEMPAPLLLELLGSRKDILFCEGQKGSIDEKLYNILFPEYTISPVESCLDVINYTKAFNRLPNTITKAIGVIDSDHHGNDRLLALVEENIYALSVSEPENLLLDKDFLKEISKQLLKDDSIVNNIEQDVIKQLEKEIELQASNYITAKINYYFNDSHVTKGNDLISVKENYQKFTSEIKIQDWHEKRVNELTKIVKDKDYSKVLSVFNNKGLKAIANKHLKISDFTDRAINLLQFRNDTHTLIKRHFPERLINKNGL